MCSASGHGDLTGKASWELGELVAPMLVVNGSKGPRGKGSTRGSGGKRRSSLMSAVLDALERERTLWGSMSRQMLHLSARLKDNLRERTTARDVVSHGVHVFKHHGAEGSCCR